MCLLQTWYGLSDYEVEDRSIGNIHTITKVFSKIDYVHIKDVWFCVGREKLENDEGLHIKYFNLNDYFYTEMELRKLKLNVINEINEKIDV